MGDADGDGWLDLVTGTSATGVRLYRGTASGSFDDITLRSGLSSTTGTRGAWFQDYDLDGRIDLWIETSGGGQLYRNDGAAAFTAMLSSPVQDEPSQVVLNSGELVGGSDESGPPDEAQDDSGPTGAGGAIVVPSVETDVRASPRQVNVHERLTHGELW